MKKAVCTLITAGIITSMAANAALPTDAAPFQVVVPNLKSGIDITLEGLYLQPTNSDLDYVSVTTSAVDSDGNTAHNTDIKSVSPDSNFGFRIGLGYTFPDSGNDIRLSWLHYSNTDSDSINFDGTGSVTSRLNDTYQIGSVAGIFFDGQKVSWIYNDTNAVSEAKFKIDAVDLDVGQYIDIGTRLRMRLFAGLRVAQVTNNQTTTENANAKWNVDDEFYFADERHTTKGNLEYDSQYTEKFDAKFTGIGPRLGIDSTYHIGKGFGVVTQASVALLVGKADTSTTASRASSQKAGSLEECWYYDGGSQCRLMQFSESEYTQSFAVESQNTSRVVPALDARLGLNYSHVFDNESVVTVEGGYQATQYINAIDRLTADFPEFRYAELNQPAQVTRTTSNLGFSGPYLSLNWKV